MIYQPEGVPPSSARAFAKFTEPGVYSTTVTQPEDFRAYLLEQLEPLVDEFGARSRSASARRKSPTPTCSRAATNSGAAASTAAELARFFPVPSLAVVGDEIADGAFEIRPGVERPLALFDAARVDYSLRRLVHYTGSDWRAMQPWVLLTNYHRYVDQFVRWGLEQLRAGDASSKLVLPGDVVIDAEPRRRRRPKRRRRRVVWHRFQMPAYHVVRADGRGVSLVNIGVGPSNAKTITDHIAVLRPHCWLMVGHCAGLRPIAAHRRLRARPRLSARRTTSSTTRCRRTCRSRRSPKCRSRCRRRSRSVTGDRGEALKRRLRTGTVVTNDDRNWELRWTQERRRINLSRAIAVDMESATIATQGFRMRVPYGTLLCVSDKPLHGEIKLPGAANAFYERAIGEHLQIGIAALELLQDAARHAALAQAAQLRRAAVPLNALLSAARGEKVTSAGRGHSTNTARSRPPAAPPSSS